MRDPFLLSASWSVILLWQSQTSWFHFYAYHSSRISHECPQYCLPIYIRSDIQSLESWSFPSLLTQEAYFVASGILRVLFFSTQLHWSFVSYLEVEWWHRVGRCVLHSHGILPKYLNLCEVFTISTRYFASVINQEHCLLFLVRKLAGQGGFSPCLPQSSEHKIS